MAVVLLLDPLAHFLLFVCRVIIEDQMKRKLLGCVPVDLLEETKPLESSS